MGLTQLQKNSNNVQLQSKKQCIITNNIIMKKFKLLMTELPEKFPEHSIFYKILTKKINQLELKKKTSTSEEISSIQKSIENYELERQKIREMFPKRFFDNIEVG